VAGAEGGGMSGPKLLLTPELRQKVEARIEECYLKCEEHYKRKFPRAEVRYDLRNTNAGEAWMKQNRIRLNLTFLVENDEGFLLRTPGHEVAHLVAHAVYDAKPLKGAKVRPHGVEWKEVMGVIEQEPSSRHSFDITSLDIHKKDRKKSIVSTKEKMMRLLAQIEKLEPEERVFMAECIYQMGEGQ
jgi:predicted SprT family Zn-dependent metalloprotease